MIVWKKYYFILVSPSQSRLLGLAFSQANWPDSHPLHNKVPIKWGQQRDFQRCPTKEQPTNRYSSTCFRSGLSLQSVEQNFGFYIYTHTYIIFHVYTYNINQKCFIYMCIYIYMKAFRRKGKEKKSIHSKGFIQVYLGEKRERVVLKLESDSRGRRFLLSTWVTEPRGESLITAFWEPGREREQLLSATLPAIRQPALAHGHRQTDRHTHAHTHTRQLRGVKLHATANVIRSPAPPTHTHRQSFQLSPNVPLGGAETRAGRGTPPVPSSAARRRAEPAGARPVPRRAPQPAFIGDARSRHGPRT